MSTLTHKKEGLFFYLLFLTGFFLLLEVSFFIQCNEAYLAIFNYVSDNLSIPITILPGVIYFLFAQFIIHLVYCFLTWYITLRVANCFRLPPNKKIYLGISIWILGITTALVANQYFYPNSKFSGLTAIILFNRNFTKITLIFLLFFCSVLICLSFIDMMRTMIKKYFLGLFVFISAILAFSFFYFMPQPIIYHDAATHNKPNIILVGVDALRPDFLSFFGGEKATPFIDSFLSQATVFSEAVTPDARTFPSWTSILTGQHPRETGIRFNLAQQNKAGLTYALPAILRREGYETFYASDETRFSNINKHFGFDHIITPPMGLNDFLLGTFNDFPLSNLLVNTAIGKWLFPYSYGNRPVYFTYNPDRFLNLIQSALKAQRNKPLFLAVHFCLPHSPYLWADQAVGNLSVLDQYKASVVRVDQQLERFFALLNQYQLLNHAIVVLLSDHGEALALSGDRITEKEAFWTKENKPAIIPQFYAPSLDGEAINQSVGHGTDVLGLSQYHSLLAFKLYGLGKQQYGIIPGVVSLIDINPTILSLVGKAHLAPLKMNVLADIITAKHAALLPRRHIFIESDYSPASIRTVYPETKEVLLDGVALFQIDAKTTRLTVKETMAKMIISSKQYADIYGEWMLALYPQGKNTYIPILINLETGVWTNDLHSAFAQQSPASHMLTALKAFYGDEINNSQLTSG